jgi:hypothetical protein
MLSDAAFANARNLSGHPCFPSQTPQGRAKEVVVYEPTGSSS